MAVLGRGSMRDRKKVCNQKFFHQKKFNQKFFLTGRGIKTKWRTQIFTFNRRFTCRNINLCAPSRSPRQNRLCPRYINFSILIENLWSVMYFNLTSDNRNFTYQSVIDYDLLKGQQPSQSNISLNKIWIICSTSLLWHWHSSYIMQI